MDIERYDFWNKDIADIKFLYAVKQSIISHINDIEMSRKHSLESDEISQEDYDVWIDIHLENLNRVCEKLTRVSLSL